ncbi:MAG TPA: hypothetical protein DCM05_02280 [Elusimicrobia bacterium]|nr:hypothetical protein [Elusimicrobiota bacterium]
MIGILAAAVGISSATLVWQPSHQTDTGEAYDESAVCGGIVDAAMAAAPALQEHRVWSRGVKNLHHADSGTNTLIAHTSALVGGRKSGYAYELDLSNALKPLVFVGVHNNGGTKRHAVWAYVHDGDRHEAQSRRLAALLLEEVAAATDLQDRGTHLDSSTGRNDYRCRATGKLAFYSIDENVNAAPYRVLMEIGDLDASREFLQDPANQKRLGEALKRGVARFLESLPR